MDLNVNDGWLADDFLHDCSDHSESWWIPKWKMINHQRTGEWGDLLPCHDQLTGPGSTPGLRRQGTLLTSHQRWLTIMKPLRIDLDESLAATILGMIEPWLPLPAPWLSSYWCPMILLRLMFRNSTTTAWISRWYCDRLKTFSCCALPHVSNPCIRNIVRMSTHIQRFELIIVVSTAIYAIPGDINLC